MTFWELQKAVISRLEGYSDLTSLLASDPRASRPAIYDHVPQDATFPYVVVGDTTALEWDTDTSTGHEHTVTIHAWSEYRGRKEVKQIQGELYNALHRHDLSITGEHTVTCEHEYAESLLDPDGITRHGVARFRVLTEAL